MPRYEKVAVRLAPDAVRALREAARREAYVLGTDNLSWADLLRRGVDLALADSERRVTNN